MNPVFNATGAAYSPKAITPAPAVLRNGVHSPQAKSSSSSQSIHFGNNILGTLANEASQLRFLLFHPTSPIGVEAIAAVNFLQVALPVTGIAFLLYAQGLENQRHANDEKLWLKQLGVGAANAGMALYAATLFPIVNGLLGVYRASRENNVYKQVEQAVKTTTAAAAGFLAAYVLGNGAGEFYWALDLKRIQEFRNNPKFANVMSQLSSRRNHKEVQDVPKSIQALYKTFDAYKKELEFVEKGLNNRQVPDAKVLSDLRVTLTEQLAETGHVFNNAAATIFEKDQRSTFRGVLKHFDDFNHFDKFRRVVLRTHAWDVKASRFLGPTFAVILSSSLIGLPVAKGIMSAVNKMFPKLASKDVRTTGLTADFFEHRNNEMRMKQRAQRHHHSGDGFDMSQYWEPTSQLSGINSYNFSGLK